MAHPFSALSPDLQREQLTAADAWPLLSIALDSQQPPRLLASARHMPANVDVLSIPLAGSPIEASPLLWWFAFTEQLTENEISLLTTHHDASWLPYASCMSALIDWGARASTLDQATLASAALAHISPFSPDLPPSIPFRRLLDLLAFEEAIKPKVARVALLHWLATWAAQQTGSRLACPPLSYVFDPASPHVRVPAPCPLSAQRWYTELNHRKDAGSIRTPNISTAITAAARRANPQAEDPPAGPGAPAPAPAPAPPDASQPLSLLPPRPQPPQPAAPPPSDWETLFQAGPSPSSQDTLTLLDGLSSVPEADAHQTAMCIVAMGKNCHLPPRTVQHLSVSTSTASLVLAAKGAWHSCPDLHKPTLRLHLNKLLTLVSQRYGAAASSAASLPALQAIQPLITAAQAHADTPWLTAAFTIASAPSFPIEAYQDLQHVSSADTLRAAIARLCGRLSTPAQFQELISYTKTALPPRSTADLDWFRLGSSAPPTHSLQAPGAAAPPAPLFAPPLPGQPPLPGAPAPSATGATPASSVPTFAPVGSSPATTGVVRVSGLRLGLHPSMAVTLTHNLQTVVYVTDADARRGHAFAHIAPALHTSLFASLPTRVIQHNEGWSLTVQGRWDDGQPWHAPTATLNTPPPTARPSRATLSPAPPNAAASSHPPVPPPDAPRGTMAAQHPRPPRRAGQSAAPCSPVPADTTNSPCRTLSPPPALPTSRP